MASKPSRTARSAACANAATTRSRPLASSASGTCHPSANGHGGGSDGGPGVLAARQRLAALERRLAGGLAAGVGELDRKARAGSRDAPRRIEHAGERRLVGIRVEAEAAVRDAAQPLHRRWPPARSCRRGRWRTASGAADASPTRMPSLAEYWHMGATAMRLGSWMGPSGKGREEVGHGGDPWMGGRRQGTCVAVKSAARCY